MTMDRRQREDLDRHITGNYGEDQFPPEQKETGSGTYGVFALGENVFGGSLPSETFETRSEAQGWIDARPVEPGRSYEVRERTLEGWSRVAEHRFVGRTDRDCEVCGQPDRSAVHLAELPPDDTGQITNEQPVKFTDARMRVVIDGTHHPIHEQAVSLRAVAADPAGNLVEVQVAALGNGELNVVIAGELEPRHDPQTGYWIFRVWPTASSQLPPKTSNERWGVGGSRQRTDGR